MAVRKKRNGMLMVSDSYFTKNAFSDAEAVARYTEGPIVTIGVLIGPLLPTGVT